ncbi:UNVERIFIED_CONTAM: hypothetical protein GTU68_014915 [Idotea baltica]|nr:hypothetical protein [Idotea baltica]
MSESSHHNQICIVIGASHAGVNFAFSLRREGWLGKIVLLDTDPCLPYHRPPLSKAFLTEDDDIESYALRSKESYEKEKIELRLGVKVTSIQRNARQVKLDDGSVIEYDRLVIATGVRAFIPPIDGLQSALNTFVIRTADDAMRIIQSFNLLKNKNVVIIGGGYIGLEIAASLNKLGGSITILEREERILSRVTSPYLSSFFQQLHSEHGVNIHCNQEVKSVLKTDNYNLITCSDGRQYRADLIIVGAGVIVNTELAKDAGLEIENGIRVNTYSQTSDENIYAIGDCTYHYNQHYKRNIRLECVQNAVDQAKVAAASISGKPIEYNSIPWFWSDQYDIKLQMVGLSQGYTEFVVREENEKCFSIWYFYEDELLAVDAINYPKAYVLGMKFIKNTALIDKVKLASPETPFKPAELLLS